MESIKDKVAIVGMGCTRFGERWDMGAADLMIDACYEAFADAGIEPRDVQAAWLGELRSGVSGQMLSQALQFQYIHITRVENICCSGTEALRAACYAVAAGVYDIALAVGVEKLKDHGETGLRPAPAIWDMDGTFPPSPPPTQFAMAATRYMHTYGLSYEKMKTALAKTAVKNHRNGMMSPKAHIHREITVDEAMNAPMVSWPLGLLDCCGVSDGAAAAVVVRADMAKNFKDDYILVKGLGVAVGAGQGSTQDDWPFTSFPETVYAGKWAYAEAAITNPREEVDLAIVHDCFTITELIIMEDLGFSPKGRVVEDVDSGFFTLEGGLPVNTDGGLKCFGHPIGASGLRMVYEVYHQLRGKAEKRQLKKADIGLTQNLGGYPGRFTSAVAIFGRRD
jgi:acetyl-CoA C-acetyltransferase